MLRRSVNKTVTYSSRVLFEKLTVLELVKDISSQHTGHWNPSSRVQTRPKPLDFSGIRKIHSMPSFGGEVK
jgi:hypothetical protein